jgi:hypothetical protein
MTMSSYTDGVGYYLEDARATMEDDARQRRDALRRDYGAHRRREGFLSEAPRRQAVDAHRALQAADLLLALYEATAVHHLHDQLQALCRNAASGNQALRRMSHQDIAYVALLYFHFQQRWQASGDAADRKLREACAEVMYLRGA